MMRRSKTPRDRPDPKQRRFPPPLTAELQPNHYVVRDANRQQLAYVYYENEPAVTMSFALKRIGAGKKGAPNIALRCNSGTKFPGGAFYGGEAHLRRHSDCYRLSVGAVDYFSVRSVNHHRLGRHRPDIPLLRYVATHHQHWDDDHHVFDGFHHSKHSKSRRCGGTSKAR